MFLFTITGLSKCIHLPIIGNHKCQTFRLIGHPAVSCSDGNKEVIETFSVNSLPWEGRDGIARRQGGVIYHVFSQKPLPPTTQAYTPLPGEGIMISSPPTSSTPPHAYSLVDGRYLRKCPHFAASKGHEQLPCRLGPNRRN